MDWVAYKLQNLFLTVMEAGKFKIKVLAKSGVWSKPTFTFIQNISWLSSHGSPLEYLLQRHWPPSWLNYLPKLSLPIPSLGLLFQHIDLRGHKHSVHKNEFAIFLFGCLCSLFTCWSSLYIWVVWIENIFS